MKNKLQVPDNKPLADFLPTLTIKAKDFATELTSHNVIEKDLKGETPILEILYFSASARQVDTHLYIDLRIYTAVGEAIASSKRFFGQNPVATPTAGESHFLYLVWMNPIRDGESGG